MVLEYHSILYLQGKRKYQKFLSIKQQDKIEPFNTFYFKASVNMHILELSSKVKNIVAVIVGSFSVNHTYQNIIRRKSACHMDLHKSHYKL